MLQSRGGHAGPLKRNCGGGTIARQTAPRCHTLGPTKTRGPRPCFPAAPAGDGPEPVLTPGYSHPVGAPPSLRCSELPGRLQLRLRSLLPPSFLRCHTCIRAWECSPSPAPPLTPDRCFPVKSCMCNPVLVSVSQGPQQTYYRVCHEREK